MTSPTSLTERYISATVRSLRPETQEDVRTELSASIADAVEARVEQGETREEAERAVLTELGDPGVLAAGYADHPLHLIGPRYYLTWLRLLRLLLVIVPVCAMGGVALGTALSGAGIGDIIGETVAVGISVVAHVCFWVTLVFVVLERTGADTGVRWDVDRLPEPADSGAHPSDAVASIVFLAIGVVVLFWDQSLGLFPTGGEPIPVLHPGLVPAGLAMLIALMAGEALLAVAVAIRRRWTVALAVVNTALAVAFASWALSLAGRGELVNPAFVRFAFTDHGVGGDTLQVLGVLLAFALVAFPVWDIVDGWVKTFRAGRT